MGVSLTYTPVTAVSSHTAETIVAEARTLSLTREWWCEPLLFVDEGALRGATKIFLPGYTVNGEAYQEVGFEEDSLMAAHEALFILDTLAGWSRQFGITWSISLDGGEIGVVSGDGPDPGLLGMIAIVASNGESTELPEFDPTVIREIQQKYSSRH